jgi:hypothetical protein
MLTLKFLLNGLSPILARRCQAWHQSEAARQHENAAPKHDRECASASVNAATTRARDRGQSDHSRVRMNTIAKSEMTGVRLQKVCMA